MILVSTLIMHYCMAGNYHGVLIFVVKFSRHKNFYAQKLTATKACTYISA